MSSAPSLPLIPSSSRGNPSVCLSEITSTPSIWKGQEEETELLGASCFFWVVFFSSSLLINTELLCKLLLPPAFPASFPHLPACFPAWLFGLERLCCRASVGPGFGVALRCSFHCVWVVLTSLIHGLGPGSAFPSFPWGGSQVLAPVGSSWSRSCARGPRTQGPQ